MIRQVVFPVLEAGLGYSALAAPVSCPEYPGGRLDPMGEVAPATQASTQLPVGPDIRTVAGCLQIQEACYEFIKLAQYYITGRQFNALAWCLYTLDVACGPRVVLCLSASESSWYDPLVKIVDFPDIISRL